MSFKHPEILYALALLLIPIIIHLVRWKKFKKELFTNVDFLKDLEIKSRKSRKLKELLVLLSRLLAFAALIIAFAQPYFASQSEKDKVSGAQTIIYIDNSLSMSAPTINTNLLQDVLQDLQKNLDDNTTYSLLTNEHSYKNISGKRLKEILFQIPFSAKSTNHKSQIKRGNMLFEEQTGMQKNFIYISDFQNVGNQKITLDDFDNNIRYQCYTKQVADLPNISIDTLWLQNKDVDTYSLLLKLSATQHNLQSPVSILQGKKLLWRGYVDFKDSLQQKINIQLPVSNNIEAKISITDKGFKFDNDLFFTIHQPEKETILVIGENLPDYLKKIYTNDEFVLDVQPSNRVNYARLDNYTLIILNEITAPENISTDALQKYVSNYGHLLIIPPSEKPETVQKLLTEMHLSLQTVLDTNKVFLNKINYSNPLFNKVFLKKTQNFAYPFVKKHLRFEPGGDWLYQLSDQTAFAQIFDRKGKIVVLNAGLSIQNTNFTEAPYLVVPLFYQVGKMQGQINDLYLLNGQKNHFSIHINIPKDGVLHMQNDKSDIIPMQVNQFNKVLISTTDLPDKPGIYQLKNEDKTVTSVAYNYPRKENIQQYLAIPSDKNIQQITSFENFVNTQKNYFEEQSIWKRFVILALLFLLMEMLLIRFWK